METKIEYNKYGLAKLDIISNITILRKAYKFNYKKTLERLKQLDKQQLVLAKPIKILNCFTWESVEEVRVQDDRLEFYFPSTYMWYFCEICDDYTADRVFQQVFEQLER